MEIKSIKEISIVCNYFKESKTVHHLYFQEKIRISKGWISFVKINPKINKELYKWSFKNDSERYTSLWNVLKEEVVKMKDNYKTDIIDYNNTNFNIRIKLNDDSYSDYTFNNDFYNAGLIDIQQQILNMIPDTVYDLPFIIAPFNSYELNKSKLAEININEICAIMYAEWGAMGWPGIIQLIDSSLNIYIADTLYNDNCDVNQIEIMSYFEMNDEDIRYNCSTNDIKFIEINSEQWIYLDLGMGNHLYTRKDFFNLFGSRINDMANHRRYRKFVDLIRF